MLTPERIETFCRWWSRSVGRTLGSDQLFAHAYAWKHRVIHQQELNFAYVAFVRSRYIPEYVHEYWRTRVLPIILIQGGIK
jgi:hypothetical protein